MSDFEDVKPYTQAELDQQAIWANEFDQWWGNEGQYHRAGGNDYCKTFAWWAWLNREQKQQATIDDLKAKLSEVQRVIDIYEDGDIDSLSDFARYVKQALRGAND